MHLVQTLARQASGNLQWELRQGLCSTLHGPSPLARTRRSPTRELDTCALILSHDSCVVERLPVTFHIEHFRPACAQNHLGRRCPLGIRRLLRPQRVRPECAADAHCCWPKAEHSNPRPFEPKWLQTVGRIPSGETPHFLVGLPVAGSRFDIDRTQRLKS